MLRRRPAPFALPRPGGLDLRRQQCLRARGQPLDVIERLPQRGRVARRDIVRIERTDTLPERRINRAHGAQSDAFDSLGYHSLIMTEGCDSQLRTSVVLSSGAETYDPD